MPSTSKPSDGRPRDPPTRSTPATRHPNDPTGTSRSNECDPRPGSAPPTKQTPQPVGSDPMSPAPDAIARPKCLPLPRPGPGTTCPPSPIRQDRPKWIESSELIRTPRLRWLGLEPTEVRPERPPARSPAAPETSNHWTLDSRRVSVVTGRLRKAESEATSRALYVHQAR